MAKSFATSFRVEFSDTALTLGKTHPDIISKVDRKPVYVRQWKRRVNAGKLDAWRREMDQADPGNHVDFARIVHQLSGNVVCESADARRRH